MTGTQKFKFASFDQTELAFHRAGEGRPVILLHGLFSSSHMNWIKWGHHQRLAGAGFEAIMLDFRVHGDSPSPHDPAAYPPDVLLRDAAALVAHLGLGAGEYDLVGFSLGARAAIHACAKGELAPRKLIACGMGYTGLAQSLQRTAYFVRVIDEFDTIKPGDPAYPARAFLKSQGVDRTAARMLLKSLGPFDVTQLANITMPARVICGTEDGDNGSGEDLAKALPNAAFAQVPGNHMSSVTFPELGDAITAFLEDQ